MKVFTYSILAVGLVLFLNVMGFGLTTGVLLEKLGINVGGIIGITNSAFFNNIFLTSGILGAIGAVIGLGAIFIGITTRSQIENFLILPFITGSLVLFVGAFTGIMIDVVGRYGATNWVTTVVILFLAPFTLGYIISLVEFFRASD